MPNTPEIVTPLAEGKEKVIAEAVVTRPNVEKVQNVTPAESTAANTFLGASAVSKIKAKGERNVALGSEALAAVTTGIKNVAIGAEAALKLTTGEKNVALGDSALTSTTTGAIGNVAVGPSAMQETTSGTENIAIGESAMLSNLKGTQNIAIGTAALSANKEGKENVGVGASALQANKEAKGNVAVGFEALNETTGELNVAIGFGAGKTLKAVSNKLFIANNETEALIEGDFAAKEIKRNTTKEGFFKTTPASQEKVAAAASNLGTTETLANSLRTMVIKLGLMKE